LDWDKYIYLCTCITLESSLVALPFPTTTSSINQFLF
jgi:hypothetical protein